MFVLATRLVGGRQAAPVTAWQIRCFLNQLLCLLGLTVEGARAWVTTAD